VVGVTSVKEFRVEEPATPDALGRGAFVFTDDYSVFDWGKMPDPIPDKGASLCAMGAASFESMHEAGIPTHYRGVVAPESGDVVALGEVSAPPREMAIDLAQVPDLPHQGRSYDYDAFHAEAGENYVVPLEIVFRNRVPVGSSLRRRTDPGDHGLEFDEWPEGAVEFPEPVVEFSTKYEESDRYLSHEEADRIAGNADVEDLETLAREVNRVVTDRAERAGLTHEDGKIECLYFQGEVRVADVTGTLDENRFSHEGRQVSKEAIRQYHKRTQPEWVAAVEDAKERAKAEDVADWRRLCELEPEPLSGAVLEVARDAYAAAANAYVGRDLFDAPALAEAVAALEDL
jgi:phosphoribosylaminoimidazole-succinocarboxamide synthase